MAGDFPLHPVERGNLAAFAIAMSEAATGDDVARHIAELCDLRAGSVLLHRLSPDERTLDADGSWNLEPLIVNAYRRVPVHAATLPIVDAIDLTDASIAPASFSVAPARVAQETYPLIQVLIHYIPVSQRDDWRIVSLPITQRGLRLGGVTLVVSPDNVIRDAEIAAIFASAAAWMSRRSPGPAA